MRVTEHDTKKVLVTAFMPFGGDSVNPTEAVLQRLPCVIGNVTLHKLLLPVEFYRCTELAVARIEALSPDAVILLGQAGGRNAITPERIAINVMDASIADNAGYIPRDVPISKGGNAAYFSTLPIRAIENALLQMGLPCSISNSAGTYVCNSLMYGVLDQLGATGSNAIAGFIHVPFEKSQVVGISGRETLPFMTIDAMTAAIIETIRIVAESV